MGFFDTKKTTFKKDNNLTTQDRLQELQKDQNVNQVLNTDPQAYTDPNYNIKAQAKAKLTTSAYYKGLFSQEGLFSNKFNNLSFDNLKYVFNDYAINSYTNLENTTDFTKTDDYKAFRTLKDDVPQKLIGGEDVIDIDDIDLKKTYNSEAKALMMN